MIRSLTGCFTCWIDDSEEQDQKVLDRTLAGAEQMPVSPVQTGEEVQICQQIWGDMGQVWVVIPFAHRIRFQSVENRRNPDMLLDLIRTNATLRQQQREVTEVNGTSCVIATEEDFHQAARLFVALNGKHGGQANKLTKREASLIEAIATLGLAEVTITQLQRATGWTNSSIGKLLHGYQSYGKSYSGILDKCPAVSYLDRTVTRGDDGCTTLRRSKAYLWDPALYHAWVKGGSVWLAPDQHTDDQNPSDPPDAPEDGYCGSLTPGESNPGAEEKNDEGEVFSELSRSDISSPAYDSAGSVDQGEDPPGTGSDQHFVGVSLTSIQPQEFFPVDGLPDHRRCSVCGKRPTQYQERMTIARMQDPPRSNLMLCPSCYNRAVSRAAASIIPLPGVIDTTLMIRQTSSIGTCHLCDLRPAVWSDPASRTRLCESCYQRESGLIHPDITDSDSKSGPP